MPFMRKQLFIYILLTGSLCMHFTTSAQRASVGCVDQAMRLQAEQLKLGFVKQSYVVYRDAMLSMESRQPAPIVVQLNKGQLYQFIYVGSKGSSKISMEIMDGEDNKIDERILKNPAHTNYVVYSFIPDKTDAYLFVLTQHQKSKTMCGSFCILQQQTTPPTAPVSPNRNSGQQTTTPSTTPRSGNVPPRGNTTPRR